MPSLRDREQVVLAICIGVVLLYASLQGVIRPLQEKSHDVVNQILAQQRTLKKDLRIIQKAKSVATKESYYRDTFRQVGTDEENVSKIISEIEKLATKVDLHISELKPTNMKRQGKFNTFSVNLVFDAPFERIVEFLDTMQRKPYYFTIDELDILKQMGMNSSDLRVNLFLSKIFILD